MNKNQIAVIGDSHAYFFQGMKTFFQGMNTCLQYFFYGNYLLEGGE